MAESKDKQLSALQSGRAFGCLMIVIQPSFELVTLDECPQDGFDFFDKHYYDLGHGSFTGFYDWLRNSERKIVGVRYWPFEEFRFICEKLAHSSSVLRAQDFSHLDILFADIQDMNWHSSDDQDFGSNQLYSTDDDEWSISFATTGLNDTEAEDIFAAAVHLSQLRPT
jgi:hypothetical protein